MFHKDFICFISDGTIKVTMKQFDVNGTFNETIGYLKSIFGETIVMDEYQNVASLPRFLQTNYAFCQLEWNSNSCVLLRPLFAWHLPEIKKQYAFFQKNCACLCALCVDGLTALQRRNLVESHVPFVSLSQQVYFPFWGCLFRERTKAPSLPSSKKMVPGTQAVFLYLYYHDDSRPVNLSRVAKDLSLSKATCTRAFDDLLAFGLISQKKEGVNKWISPAFSKEEYLRRGYPKMKSPVQRKLFIKPGQSLPYQLIGGIRALSDKTELASNSRDGAVVISKAEANVIPSHFLCSQCDFEDFGGEIVEVWSYDPHVFSKQTYVDDISLLLSVGENTDERIQKSLDQIRAKHGLLTK